MIRFDVRTEEQEKVIKTIFDIIKEFEQKYEKEQIIKEMKEKGYPATLVGEFMTKAMSGDLAKHKSLFLSSEKKGIPVKLESLRLLMMAYVDEYAEDINIPESMINYAPLRGLLTGMGLAAIASGKGGRSLIMSKYLPELMKGHTMCYGITEPDAGTNTNNISTTAVEEGDHYIINGQKIFISEADTSRFIVVIAKVVSKDGNDGIGTFVLDIETEGIKRTPLDIATLGDTQYSIFFDDVKAPKDCLVGEKKAKKEGGITSSVFQSLNLERIGAAFGALMACKITLAKAVKQSKKNRTSGRSMGSYLNIKHKLAAVKLKMELANLAAKKAAEEFDNKGEPKVVGMYANMAKLVSTEAAYDACTAAIDVYGVEGLNKQSQIGPLTNMIRLTKIAPINNEMVLNFLGENLLGLPKSYR